MAEKILAGGGDDYVPIRDLRPGERIRLKGDILAEVLENPGDGMWIIVRYLETPAGPVTGGDPEMVTADDVIARA
ncbi:MAG: hypothetical protein ABSH03_01525 [Candidatus Lustribacter sp.]|jgi:hypothetical protein